MINPTILESATLSLSLSFTTWHDLEERLIKGRAYTKEHNRDARAAALLITLQGEATTAEKVYECANATYKAVQP